MSYYLWHCLYRVIHKRLTHKNKKKMVLTLLQSSLCGWSILVPWVLNLYTNLFFICVRGGFFTLKWVTIIFCGSPPYLPVTAEWVECSAMGQEAGVQFQVVIIPKTQKMVFDVALLNTQHCNVRIKVNWSNPWNGIVYTPRCGNHWKGSLRVTKVANFTYFIFRLNQQNHDVI